MLFVSLCVAEPLALWFVIMSIILFMWDSASYCIGEFHKRRWIGRYALLLRCKCIYRREQNRILPRARMIDRSIGGDARKCLARTWFFSTCPGDSTSLSLIETTYSRRLSVRVASSKAVKAASGSACWIAWRRSRARRRPDRMSRSTWTYVALLFSYTPLTTIDSGHCGLLLTRMTIACVCLPVYSDREFTLHSDQGVDSRSALYLSHLCESWSVSCVAQQWRHAAKVHGAVLQGRRGHADGLGQH